MSQEATFMAPYRVGDGYIDARNTAIARYINDASGLIIGHADKALSPKDIFLSFDIHDSVQAGSTITEARIRVAAAQTSSDSLGGYMQVIAPMLSFNFHEGPLASVVHHRMRSRSEMRDPIGGYLANNDPVGITTGQLWAYSDYGRESIGQALEATATGTLAEASVFIYGRNRLSATTQLVWLTVREYDPITYEVGRIVDTSIPMLFSDLPGSFKFTPFTFAGGATIREGETYVVLVETDHTPTSRGGITMELAVTEKLAAPWMEPSVTGGSYSNVEALGVSSSYSDEHTVIATTGTAFFPVPTTAGLPYSFGGSWNGTPPDVAYSSFVAAIQAWVDSAYYPGAIMFRWLPTEVPATSGERAFLSSVGFGGLFSPVLDLEWEAPPSSVSARPQAQPAISSRGRGVPALVAAPRPIKALEGRGSSSRALGSRGVVTSSIRARPRARMAASGRATSQGRLYGAISVKRHLVALGAGVRASPAAQGNLRGRARTRSNISGRINLQGALGGRAQVRASA
jgi:hypothetical protein